MLHRVAISPAVPVALVLAVVLVLAIVARAETRYVDAAAPVGGDGRTWATASSFLQDALAAASAGDEVRVAQGTYKPDRSAAQPGGSGDRAASFGLKSGVLIEGGYAGLAGTDPDARDAALYPTTLSGDLAGDDGPDVANCAENAYHVVTGSGSDATAVLDGVTVTAGNADGPSALNQSAGGGLLNEHGGPTIRQCRFVANRAIDGGAVKCNFGDTSFTDCQFVGNLAVGVANNTLSGGGGGLLARHSRIVVERCLFQGNNGILGGGLACMASGTLTASDCTFRGNTVVGTNSVGGGAYVDNSTQTVSSCLFEDNTAVTGGGLAHVNSGSAAVTDCTFRGNVAADTGGGLYNLGSCTMTTQRCMFTGNMAWLGGGVGSLCASHTMRSCLVAGNTANLYGGGLYGTTPVSVLCSTIVGNHAQDFGGGIYGLHVTLTLQSAIVWGNTAGYNIGQNVFITRNCFGPSKVTIGTSDVQDGLAGMYVDPDTLMNWKDGNVDADPSFTDAAGGDYRPAWPSPCINGGEPAYVPAAGEADLDGQPRVLAGCVDMGAYEYHPVGDLAGDGWIDVVDLLVFVDAWGSRIGDANYNAAADFNNDEVVDIADLLTLVDHWAQP